MKKISLSVQRAKNTLEKEWYCAVAYIDGKRTVGYGTTQQRAIADALRCQTCWGTKEVTINAGLENERTEVCPDCVGVKEFSDMTGATAGER